MIQSFIKPHSQLLVRFWIVPVQRILPILAPVADRSVKNGVAVPFVGGTQYNIWRRGTTRNVRCPDELYMRPTIVVQQTNFHSLNAILAHALNETCKSIAIHNWRTSSSDKQFVRLKKMNIVRRLLPR